MSLESLSQEYDKVRCISDRQLRVSQSLRVTNNMYNIISTFFDRKQNLAPKFSVNGGDGLLFSVYTTEKLKRGVFCTVDIIDLCKVYCHTKQNFIGDIARSTLNKIFEIPSPCYFSSDDVYMYFRFFNIYLPLEVSKSESDRHNNFCETLSKFFMTYSKKIWQYLKNDTKNTEKITKMFSESLKGQATGDALGFLVEGQSRKVCEQYINRVVKTREFSRYGVHRSFGHKGNPRYTTDLKKCAYRLGQYTDDTQLCRELIKSIKEKGSFNSGDFSERLIALFHKSNLMRKDSRYIENKDLNISTGVVGYGKATRKSIQCLADGCSWEQTGALFKSQGNGGCMRVAPIGVLYFEQPWRAAEVASQQSMGTHGSARCKATCVMIASASRLACESAMYRWSYHLPKHPELFCKRLSQQIRGMDHKLAEAVKLIPDWLKERDEQTLVCKVAQKGCDLGDSTWSGGRVISAGAVQASLFAVLCFLKFPDSFEDCVSMAIRAGGDTDTVAAMCGAIVSSRVGCQMDVGVNDNGAWDSKSLTRLAIDTRNKILE